MIRQPTIIVLLCAGIVCMTAAILHEGVGHSAQSDGMQSLIARGAFEPNNVQSIRIVREEQDMTFERSNVTWRQTKPFECLMTPYSMRQHVIAAQDLMVDQVLDADTVRELGGPSILGLDPPRATFQMQTVSSSVVLHLGRLVLGGRAYIAVEGSTETYLVNQDLHQRIVKMDSKEWRDRRLFPDASIDAMRVIIELPDVGVHDEYVRERKTWRLERPIPTRLDQAAMEAFFQNVGRAAVSGFIEDQPENLAIYGLHEPEALISIVPPHTESDDPMLSVLVGNEVGTSIDERYCMIANRPVVMKAPGAVLRGLLPELKTMIDLTPCGVLAADVGSLRIQGSQGEFILKRDLDRWISPTFHDREADAKLVNEFVDVLTNARATHVSFEPHDYSREEGLVVLSGFGLRPLTTVRISRDPDGLRWRLDNGDNVQRIYPETLVPRLTPGDFGI